MLHTERGTVELALLKFKLLAWLCAKPLSKGAARASACFRRTNQLPRAVTWRRHCRLLLHQTQPKCLSNLSSTRANFVFLLNPLPHTARRETTRVVLTGSKDRCKNDYSLLIIFFSASPQGYHSPPGCPNDDLQDGPHGHRPRFCSSVTSTPSFSPNTALRRDVRCLSHTHGLVVDSAPRTVSLISRRTLLSPFRSSTASMTPVCGVRTLPTLLLLKSRHRIGSPLRSSACGNPLKISS